MMPLSSGYNFYLYLVVLLSLLLPRPAIAMGFGDKTETYQVALHTFGFWDSDLEVKLDVAVWYPGVTQSQIAHHDGWIVQTGSHKRSIAKVIPGFYPVILLSHDTASSYFANNDVAAALAAHGFFVIVPAHTGDTTVSGDSIYDAHLLADRPLHLLKALDLVLSKPEFAPFVDESRIGLLGVGTGAVTVSQVAGLRPQPEFFANYCTDNRVYDVNCAGWSHSLLHKFVNDVALLFQERGESALTPSLDTFAPKFLEEAPIVEEDIPPPPEKPKEEKPSLLATAANFFKKDKPEAVPAEVQPPVEPVFQLPADFQGGLLYGSTMSGNPFTLFTPVSGNDWIFSVNNTLMDETEPTFSSSAPKKDKRPFRRPAHVRNIKAISFLAPTYGFFFPPETPNTELPALSVFPEFNTFYPHKNHAEPYIRLFPSCHEVEVISKADHYALFATCVRELAELLPESCGNLYEEDKEEADNKKITAITLFFRQYLGAPLPPQPPTGLKAVHEQFSIS